MPGQMAGGLEGRRRGEVGAEARGGEEAVEVGEARRAP